LGVPGVSGRHSRAEPKSYGKDPLRGLPACMLNALGKEDGRFRRDVLWRQGAWPVDPEWESVGFVLTGTPGRRFGCIGVRTVGRVIVRRTIDKGRVSMDESIKAKY
jgi:hypothetical protein